MAAALVVCLLSSEAAQAAGAAAVSKSAPVISSDLALIRGAAQFSGAPTVINIQDAHASLGAQHGIAAVLGELVRNYDLKVVAVEGAAGPVDTSLLSSFTVREAREAAGEYLLKQGRISASEFFAIVEREPARLFGAEDAGLYLANVEAFRTMAERKPHIARRLEALRSAVGRLERRVYAPRVQEFERLRFRHRKGGLDFPGYWDAVRAFALNEKITVRTYPQIEKMVRASRLEKHIDFAEAGRERERLAAELSRALPPSESEAVQRRLKAFGEGRVAAGEPGGVLGGRLHQDLMTRAARHGIGSSRFPELAKYARYAALGSIAAGHYIVGRVLKIAAQAAGWMLRLADASFYTLGTEIVTYALRKMEGRALLDRQGLRKFLFIGKYPGILRRYLRKNFGLAHAVVTPEAHGHKASEAIQEHGGSSRGQLIPVIEAGSIGSQSDYDASGTLASVMVGKHFIGTTHLDVSPKTYTIGVGAPPREFYRHVALRDLPMDEDDLAGADHPAEVRRLVEARYRSLVGLTAQLRLVSVLAHEVADLPQRLPGYVTIARILKALPWIGKRLGWLPGPKLFVPGVTQPNTAQDTTASPEQKPDWEDESLDAAPRSIRIVADQLTAASASHPELRWVPPAGRVKFVLAGLFDKDHLPKSDADSPKRAQAVRAWQPPVETARPGFGAFTLSAARLAGVEEVAASAKEFERRMGRVDHRPFELDVNRIVERVQAAAAYGLNNLFREVALTVKQTSVLESVIKGAAGDASEPEAGPGLRSGQGTETGRHGRKRGRRRTAGASGRNPVFDERALECDRNFFGHRNSESI